MAALACVQFLTFLLVITPVSLLRTGLYGDTDFAALTQAFRVACIKTHRYHTLFKKNVCFNQRNIKELQHGMNWHLPHLDF